MKTKYLSLIGLFLFVSLIGIVFAYEDINASAGVGGVFTNFVNSFNKIFPEHSSLSFFQVATYTLLTMAIVSVIILFLSNSFSTKGVSISPITIGILAVMNFMLLGFFVTIKYIPIIVIIFFALGAIGLAYFKLKGATP